MPCQRKRVIIRPSSFDGAPFERKQPARPALDEQDDEHQHKDLAQHGAGIGFEELVDDAERGRADQRAEQIADAVLGKILVLVFIILFIQRRPRGLFALKGRSVE